MNVKIRHAQVTSRWWLYCFFVLLIINGIVVLRDLTPRISLKIARTAMASSFTDSEYLQALRKKSLGLIRTPQLVPITDEQRFLILEDLRNINGNALSYSAPDAMLAKAIVIADSTMANPEYLQALREYYDHFVDKTGNLKRPIKNLDVALHGEALIYLAQRTGDSRYHHAASQLAQYLLTRTVTEGASLAYRPQYIGGVRLADALGMTAPFLAQYGALYNNADATALAVSQLREFIQYGIESRSGLPFHGYNPDKNYSPVGLIGWGRGAGWYALGIIDTIRWLPRENRERKELEASASRLAQTVRFFQNNAGGWDAILNAPSSFDSSATAMLAYFLRRALDEGIIDASYNDSENRAVAALKQHTRIDGTVDFSQGDRMGLDRGSQHFGPTPYAQGMTFAVMSLVMQIENNRTKK
jgi:unsaturated rhamnogalacturonyl hydrolase